MLGWKEDGPFRPQGDAVVHDDVCLQVARLGSKQDTLAELFQDLKSRQHGTAMVFTFSISYIFGYA
jgi:hypothetical protein